MPSEASDLTVQMCRLIWIFSWRTCSLVSFLIKHAYSNITENFTTKKWKFSDKNSDIFHISAQNIDCGDLLEPRRGSSNGYPQSMFLSRSKKNNVYPCKPQFYYIKVGLKGSKLYRYRYVFMMSLGAHVRRYFFWQLGSFFPSVWTEKTQDRL